MAALWRHACRGMGRGASPQERSRLAMVATWLCHGEVGFFGKQNGVIFLWGLLCAVAGQGVLGEGPKEVTG